MQAVFSQRDVSSTSPLHPAPQPRVKGLLIPWPKSRLLLACDPRGVYTSLKHSLLIIPLGSQVFQGLKINC